MNRKRDNDTETGAFGTHEPGHIHERRHGISIYQCLHARLDVLLDKNLHIILFLRRRPIFGGEIRREVLVDLALQRTDRL